MEIAVMKSIPPHIRFHSEPVENRDKSIASGHYVADEVHHVTVTPIGSKDCIVKSVAEYFQSLEQQVREERFPAEWLSKFKDQYNHWLKGEEMPVEGTPIKNWPVATPAEVAVCTRNLVLTVENLAVANEETVRRLGMGGLQLKQRAVKYLEAANGPGKITAEIEALKAALLTLKTRNDEVEKRLAQYEVVNKIESPVKFIKTSDPDKDPVQL